MGSLETKYKRSEYGLTFTEKWNTDNTLGTEITVEDQVRNVFVCCYLTTCHRKAYIYIYTHTHSKDDHTAFISDLLLFLTDCQRTEVDFWHNLLTKHWVRWIKWKFLWFLIEILMNESCYDHRFFRLVIIGARSLLHVLLRVVVAGHVTLIRVWR